MDPPDEDASGRASFNLALAGIVVPFGSFLLSGGLAIHHQGRPSADPRHAVWTRRLFGLAFVDLLVLLSVVAFSSGRLPRPEAVPDGPRLGVTLDARDAGHGATVAGERPGSPAERAGVRVGDVIVEVDGHPIDHNPDLTALIGATPNGDARVLRVDRAGERLEIAVTPSRSPPPAGPLFQPEEHGHVDLRGFAGLGAELLVIAAPLGLVAWMGRRRGALGPRSPLRFWASFVGVLAGSLVALVAVSVALDRALGGTTLGGSLLGLAAGSGSLLGGAVILRRSLARAGALGIESGQASLPATVLMGVGYMLAGAFRVGLVLSAASALLHFPRVDPGREIRGLATPGAPLAVVLLVLAAVVLAPVGEEVLFRGVLLPWLGRWLRPATALWISAGLFAVAHLRYGPYLIVLAVYGLVLGWARMRTGDLRASIVLHMIINGVAFVAALRGG